MPTSNQSSPAFRRRLLEWIAEGPSEEAADRFVPWLLRALGELGYEPYAPMSEATFHSVTEELRKADVTPARMQRALREAPASARLI